MSEYRKYLKRNFPHHAKLILKGKRKARSKRLKTSITFFLIPLLMTLGTCVAIYLSREFLFLEIQKNFHMVFENVTPSIIHTMIYTVLIIGVTTTIFFGIIGYLLSQYNYKHRMIWLERAEAYTKSLWLQNLTVEEMRKTKKTSFSLGRTSAK